MTVWVDNAWLSVLFAALTLVLLVVPALVARHAHTGDPRTRTWRIPRPAARLLALLYATALVAYTQFPLPTGGLGGAGSAGLAGDSGRAGEAAAWCAAHHIRHNLVPFDFVRMIAHRTHGLVVVRALQDIYLLQVVLNLLFFVPLGLLLARWVMRSVRAAVLVGLGVSVTVEVLQGTGLLGLFPCPYRIADVDDVLVNVLGTALGALLVRAHEWRRSGAASLPAAMRAPRAVGTWRRLAGMALDATAGLVVAVLVQAGARVVVLVLPGTRAAVQGHTGTLVTLGVSLAVAVTAVTVLPALTGGGGTLGQTMVMLTPRWRGGGGVEAGGAEGGGARRVVRALAVPGPLAVGLLASQAWPGQAEWIQLPGLVWVLLAVAMVPGTRTHRSLSGVLTGAEFVDARGAGVGAPDPTGTTSGD